MNDTIDLFKQLELADIERKSKKVIKKSSMKFNSQKKSTVDISSSSLSTLNKNTSSFNNDPDNHLILNEIKSCTKDQLLSPYAHVFDVLMQYLGTSAIKYLQNKKIEPLPISTFSQRRNILKQYINKSMNFILNTLYVQDQIHIQEELDQLINLFDINQPIETLSNEKWNIFPY